MLRTKVKEYRTRMHLKQEELARMANVRRETIVHLESGRYNPSLKLAMAISKILNVSVENLFFFDEDDRVM